MSSLFRNRKRLGSRFLPSFERLEDRLTPSTDITLAAAGATTGGAFDTNGNFVPTAATALINVADIQNLLNSGTSVTISTSSSFNGAGALTQQAGASIAKTAGGNAALVLQANTNLTLNDAITSSASNLDLVLQADSTAAGNGSGTVTLAGPITTNGGIVTVSGDDLAMGNPVDTGAAAVTIQSRAGTAIGVGTPTAPFSISGAELAEFTAANVTIGDGKSDITVAGLTTNATDTIGHFTLDASQSGHTVHVTGYSAFAPDTVITGGTLRFDAGATLTSDSSLELTSVANPATAAGALTLNANNGVTLDNSLTAAGAVTINADDDASGAGDFNLGAGATLDAGANGIDITAGQVQLDGSLKTTSFVSLTPTHSEQIGIGTDSSSFNITGAELQNITAHDLIIGSDQSGNILVSGLTSDQSKGISGTIELDALASGSTVTFDGGGSTFHSLDLEVDGGVSFNDDLTVQGDLSVNAGDSITQAGTLEVQGTSSFDAGNTSITLTDPSNDFLGTVSLHAGRDVSLNAAGDLVLGASNIGGNLTVTADGSITDSGVVTVAGTATLTTHNDAGASIMLDAPGSSYAGLVLSSLDHTGTNPAPGIISVVTPGPLGIESVTTAGPVSLTAGDVIASTGSLTGSTLTAETLNDAGAAIDLSDTGNDFDSVTLLALNAAGTAPAGTVNYADANDVTVGMLAATSATFTSQAGTVANPGGTTFSPDLHGGPLQVSGYINLNGTTLGTVSGGTVTAGQEIVLVQNNSPSPVTGTFTGLPEGALVSSNFLGSGMPAHITYQGGNGRDVAILAGAGAASFQSPINAAGNNLVLRLDATGTELQYLVNGTVTDTRPLSSVTTIPVTGVAGQADALTIDESNGIIPVPIAINGGGSGSTLEITGGTLPSLTYDATGAGAGTLSGGSLQVSFANLGPLPITIASQVGTMTIAIADNQGHVLAVGAGPAGQDNVILDGGLESISVADPKTALVLDGGAGNDTVSLTSLDAGFHGQVLVNGFGGNDIFDIEYLPNVTFVVDGGSGNNTLNFDAAGQSIGMVPGAFTSKGHQVLAYSGIGSLGVTNAPGVGSTVGSATGAGGSLAGLTPAEHFVQSLYLDVLGRPGAKAELDGWAALVTGPGSPSQAAVVAAIEGSLEARDREVKSWYHTYLGRDPQSGEEIGWAAALVQGATQELILNSIFSSLEFYQHAQAEVSSGTADERFVQALYQALLQRTPTAGEVSSWAGTLPQLGRSGLAATFLGSAEYRMDEIDALYALLMHRPADTAGLNAWVASGVDLHSIRLAFESSPEFFVNG